MIRTIEQWVCDMCNRRAVNRDGTIIDGEPRGWHSFIVKQDPETPNCVESHLCENCLKVLFEQHMINQTEAQNEQ